MKNLKIEITKTLRKSISLRFNTEWILIVRAPKFMSHSQIQKFITKNTAWIEKQYDKILFRQQNNKFYLMGEEVDSWIIAWDSVWFYKQEAKKYIIPRSEYLAEKYWFQYENIRITSAMTRWGSCSSKKNLSFSYRLIMAQRQCIDYVIIHELCHLRQMNHSAKFWREVSQIMPEYKEYEKHLKEFWWRYRV